MQDVERQRVVERILEDEALTADLIDPAARFLLEWVVNQIQVIEQGLADRSGEEGVRRLTELREAIRHVARLAGQAPPEEQLQQVQALLEGQVREECGDETLS